MPERRLFRGSENRLGSPVPAATVTMLGSFPPGLSAPSGCTERTSVTMLSEEDQTLPTTVDNSADPAGRWDKDAVPDESHTQLGTFAYLSMHKSRAAV